MIPSLLLYAKFIFPRLGISSEKGQTLAEYSLIFMLIVLVVIGALTLFGTSLSAYYDKIIAEFP